jgi:hypothetical protein
LHTGMRPVSNAGLRAPCETRVVETGRMMHTFLLTITIRAPDAWVARDDTGDSRRLSRQAESAAAPVRRASSARIRPSLPGSSGVLAKPGGKAVQFEGHLLEASLPGKGVPR